MRKKILFVRKLYKTKMNKLWLTEVNNYILSTIEKM